MPHPLLTKQETTVFVVWFLLLLSSQSWVLLVAGLGVFSFFVMRRKELYFLWSTISPRITGSAPILEYLLDLAREEGPGNNEVNDVFRLDIPFMHPMFFVFKPSYVKRVLSLEASSFPSNGQNSILVKLAANSGQNILLCEGPPSPHWVKFREVTSPINKDRHGETSLVAQMFEVAWRTTQERVHHFDAKRGQDVDLFYELYHVMIHAHNRALFGEDAAITFTYPGLSDEMYDVITEAGLQLKFSGTSPAKERTLRRQADNISDAVLKMAKSSTSPFMVTLLEAYHNGLLTEKEFHSNLMVFEYAQAPLHVVFWVLYLLALHPEDEKKVMHEVASVLAQGPLRHNRMAEFKYLNRVVAETLRLYPGVGLMQPRFPKTNTMFGKHFIPEGSFVFLCPFVMQRNSKYWPNPDDFDPSREDLDTYYSGEKITQIPFGYGPRQCQGQYFAQDFIKVTVISLLQHYKIAVAPGQKAAIPTELGFLRPAEPVYFRFSDRVLPNIPPPCTTDLKEPLKVEILPPQPAHKFSLSSSLGSPTRGRRGAPFSSPSAVKRNPPLAKRRASTHQDQFSSDIKNFLSKRRASASHQNQLLPGGKKKKRDMLVVYGSQSGNARGFASRLVSMAELRNITVVLMSLSDLDPDVIPQYKLVVVATSTHGEGGPPSNAETFNAWLENEHPPTLWNEIQFAVLSLGSSLHSHPFKFGNFVSQRFEQLGAKRIMPDQNLDEVEYNQQEVFFYWSNRLFQVRKEGNRRPAPAVSIEMKDDVVSVGGTQDLQLPNSLLDPPFVLCFTNMHLKSDSNRTLPDNAVITSVVNNELANSDPTNPIYSLTLKYTNENINLQAGDNVAVIPVNNEDLVTKLIQRLGYPKDLVFKVLHESTASIPLSCSLGDNMCTLEVALKYFYDITSPPSRSMLQFLALNSRDIGAHKAITAHSINYVNFLQLEYSVRGVLELFPSVQLVSDDPKKEADNLAVFLGMLGPLRPRYYSIANSPDVSPGTIRIVYKVVRYTKDKHGVCSNYLKSAKEGEEVAVIPVKSKFKLPIGCDVPVVLVGAGSGISPYLGFLEQRRYKKEQGHKLGKAILVHGCRSEADFAHKPTVDSAISEGVLTKLWPAYSREFGGVKSTHVQDVIEQHGNMLWRLLNQEDAVMYVCGDISVGVSVREALLRLAQNLNNWSAFKANCWFQKLISARRLRYDEWGTSAHSGSTYSISKI